MLRLSQIARQCSVSDGTVLAWVRRGVSLPDGSRKMLPATRAGNSWRVEEQDLERFLERRESLVIHPEPRARKRPQSAEWEAAHKFYWDAVKHYANVN